MKKEHIRLLVRAVVLVLCSIGFAIGAWRLISAEPQQPFAGAVCIIGALSCYAFSGKAANEVLSAKGYSGITLTAGWVWIIGVFIASVLPEAGQTVKITTGMVESRSALSIIADVVIVLLVALVCFTCLVPLWHVLMVSLSDGISAMAHEGITWLPLNRFNTGGYSLVFADNQILRGYANTLLYVIGGTAFCMFIDITAGYALSRETKLKSAMSIFVLLTAMFNGGLIPTYMVVRNLGMVGSVWSLLIPGCTNAFFVMMMMRAFAGVPQGTIEAARIDGANDWQLLFRIMLPQAMSMATVVILNSVVLQWNAWFNASIYVPNNQNAWPLQLWIRDIVARNSTFLQSINPDYNRYLIQYALIIVATLQILVAFPFFIKQMEKGVIAGAIKE